MKKPEGIFLADGHFPDFNVLTSRLADLYGNQAGFPPVKKIVGQVNAYPDGPARIINVVYRKPQCTRYRIRQFIKGRKPYRCRNQQ